MRIFFTCFLYCCLSTSLLKAQEVIFYEDFESDSVSELWTARPGKNHGVIEIVQLSAADSNHVVRIGKRTDGDGKPTLNRLDLALDLSGFPQVLLEFDIYHYFDATQPQDGLFLSVDAGQSFTKIYSFDYDNWVPRATGSIPPLNLTLLAKAKQLTLSNSTVIRFQQYGSNDFNGSEQYSDGLQLDNIRVSVPDIEYTTLPFYENFEKGTWSPALMVGNTINTNPGQSPSPFGVVEVVSYDEQRGRIVRLGSRYDKHYAANALDLHANLSSQAEVELSFKLLSNLDETHPQDGIYFSSDGGQHFTKVFDFDLEPWRKKEFGAYPPINVSQLARQHGIPLTSQFVIRFQQYDDSDFEGSRLTSDGIYLDDIALQEAAIVYAPYPFSEDFEADSLAACWKWGMPDTQDTAVAITPTGKVKLLTTENNQVISLGNSVDQLYTTNALDLHLDLSRAINPELSFKILSHYDETHALDGVYFSQDAGRRFIKVLNFDGDHWAHKAWGNFHALNIRELAAQHQMSLTDRFVIRFQQHDDDDFTGTRTLSDGILLDDIKVEEPQCQYYASLPFKETFDSTTLASYWRVGNPNQTADKQLIRPGGSASLVDTLSYSQPNALALGRLSDGELTASALDLHLDLSYQSNLELNFWMYNHIAEDREENGIWISNNGGKSYKKAYRFNPSEQQQYQHHSINLDSLVDAVALDYTQQFIIRFQHVGDRSFLGKGSFASGAFLDDVVLTNRLDAPNVQDIRLNYHDETRQPQIQWSPTESATSYDVQLYLEEVSAHHLVNEKSLTEDFLLISSKDLVSGHLYYFLIRSSNSFTKSNWSTPVAISTSYHGRISTISQVEPVLDNISGE
jgi:hypothetical protein